MTSATTTREETVPASVPAVSRWTVADQNAT
jgi:hypothetical protein